MADALVTVELLPQLKKIKSTLDLNLSLFCTCQKSVKLKYFYYFWIKINADSEDRIDLDSTLDLDFWRDNISTSSAQGTIFAYYPYGFFGPIIFSSFIHKISSFRITTKQHHKASNIQSVPRI